MRVQGLPLVRAAVPPDSEFSAQHRQLFQKQGGDRQKAKCNVLGRFPARVAVPLLSAYFIFLSFFQLGTHFGSFFKKFPALLSSSYSSVVLHRVWRNIVI